MAPPPHRRPGFSRRAQLSIFVGYVLAVGGAMAGALLLFASWLDPQGFAAARVAALEVVTPAMRPINQVRRGLADQIDIISNYWDAGRQNAALRTALARARADGLKAETLAEENSRLRAMLALRGSAERPVAIGYLMGSSPASTRRIATLSAGSTSGVRAGMPVRAPEGLIGRVIAAGPTVAQVLLLADTDTVVPVMRASDGLPAFASGIGDGRLMIRPVNIGENSLKSGDVFVTSGSGGLYGPGVAVARLTARTADGAVATAIADPARVRFVLVEQAFRPSAAVVARPPASTSAPSTAPAILAPGAAPVNGGAE